jgi:hypothetical protein
MQPISTRGFRRTALWAALALSGSAFAQGTAPGYELRRADVVRAEAGRPLADARGGAAGQAVAAVLRARGRDANTVAALRAAASREGRGGMTHMRFEQTIDGLVVHGAYAKAAFNRAGGLVHLIDHLAPVPAQGLAPAAVDARTALGAAMARVHSGVTADFKPGVARGQSTDFDGGAYFHGSPSATAVAIPLADGSMARGWLVETWTARSNQLHHTLVGGDGRVLHVEARTASDSYNVFVEDPLKGPQAIVQGPGAGSPESPSGWVFNGAQSSINIAGNNVNAYLDSDKNNRPDSGGSAVANGSFLSLADLRAAPTTTTNKAVAAQNLFYLNNVVHDILYRQGFSEVAGNFQNNNFGKGGSGSDAVQAEAQDGGGTDNANFATPADGRKPRMQMYLWTGAGPTHEVQVNSPVARKYIASSAAFGAELTPAGTTGDVAAAVPADGCTAITSALAGKVALIDRGVCEFSIKALNAQQAGAMAVVIANNQGGTSVIPMAAGTSANRVRIGVVMISQNDAIELKGQSAPNATARKLAVQPIQIDAALDSDVVFHEYGHGLTWRMIGGMSGPLAGAVGEGMSDGLAMLINGDDVIGEYSASTPLGIRRARYSGYPMTYGAVDGGEVHNDGEIYAAIIWRLMDLFGKNSRDTLFGYVVDGMNYTPATPSYEQMRDGILAAVANGPAPADCRPVWDAFAQFGVGEGATGVVTATGVLVTESFDAPAKCH